MQRHGICAIPPVMVIERLSVLVSSLDDSMATLLKDRLSPEPFLFLPSCGMRSVVETVVDKEPDILVLDVDQAETSALEAVRALREVRPGLPIIVLSAASSMRDAAFIEQGVFYYTVKPGGDELAEAVRAAGRNIVKKG